MIVGTRYWSKTIEAGPSSSAAIVAPASPTNKATARANRALIELFMTSPFASFFYGQLPSTWTVHGDVLAGRWADELS